MKQMYTLIKLGAQLLRKAWLKDEIPSDRRHRTRFTKQCLAITGFLLAGSVAGSAQPYYNELPEFLNANNVWVFPSGGLDFSSGAPAAIQRSIPHVFARAGEGACSVSDPVTGALLFYSDGFQCWNANGDVMPNGDSLLGNARGSTVQGCCIVSFPDDTGKYYLFSLNSGNAPSGSLFYNVVDMSLDSGRGNIVQGQKNILLDSTTLSEAMIAVPGNNCDVWLIVHTFEPTNPQNTYKAYHVTTAGVNPIPVLSYGKINLSLGSMCISPDRTKIASGSIMSLLGAGGAEVGRFDPNTGMITDAIQIADASGLVGPHASAFSPDNTKLYFNYSGNPSPGASLTQYDISTFDSLAVANSKEIVALVSCGSLRLYDGAIYVGGRGNNPFIGKIAQPNLSGTACDFQDSVLALLPGMAARNTFGNEAVLPYKPDTTNALVVDTSVCSLPEAMLLEPVMADAEYSYIWEDGSTSVTKQISQPGTYWVQYSNSCHTFIDTFIVADVGPVPPVIRVDEFELSTLIAYDSYQWLYDGDIIPGATGASYLVPENGDYQVVVGNAAGCTDTSEVYTVTNVSIQNVHPLARQIHVYPNPARDQVHIQSPIPVAFNLLSLEGKILRSGKETKTLTLTGISTGMYLLQIRDQDGKLVQTVKLIKE